MKKIIRQAKNQGSMVHTEIKKEPRKTVPEEKTRDLLEKHIQPAILNTFKEQKEIISKDIKEKMKITSH